MYCKPCRELFSNQSTRSANFSFKVDTIEIHEKSNKHITAIFADAVDKYILSDNKALLRVVQILIYMAFQVLSQISLVLSTKMSAGPPKFFQDGPGPSCSKAD